LTSDEQKTPKVATVSDSNM